MKTYREERACSSCRQRFETDITEVDGVSHHYPMCNKCAAEEQEEVKEQRPAITADNLSHDMAKAGVNVRKHGNCTVDTWEGSGSVRGDVREFIQRTSLARHNDPVRGLYLHGDTGTGKTHLAVAVVRMLSIARYDPIDGARPMGYKPKRPVRFERVASLITRIQDTYGSGGTAEIVAKLESVECLVLDDLGAEKATPDVLRILTDLFSARELHPTLITSNYHPGQLVERYGDDWQRLESRLGTQNFKLVKIEGEDRRFQA